MGCNGLISSKFFNFYQRVQTYDTETEQETEMLSSSAELEISFNFFCKAMYFIRQSDDICDCRVWLEEEGGLWGVLYDYRRRRRWAVT